VAEETANTVFHMFPLHWEKGQIRECVVWPASLSLCGERKNTRKNTGEEQNKGKQKSWNYI
jgi:hypothetical protein